VLVGGAATRYRRGWVGAGKSSPRGDPGADRDHDGVKALQRRKWPLMDPEPRPFDMDTVVSEVEKRPAAYDDSIEVSVLGSAVNGIGEARHADFGITGAKDSGITGAKDSGITYAKGQPLKKVPTEDLVEELFKEIDKYYAAGKKVVVVDDQAAEAARWLSENEDETAI